MVTLIDSEVEGHFKWPFSMYFCKYTHYLKMQTFFSDRLSKEVYNNFEPILKPLCSKIAWQIFWTPLHQEKKSFGHPLQSSEYLWSPSHSSDYLWSPSYSSDYLWSPSRSSDYLWSPSHISDYLWSPSRSSDYLWSP